MKNLRAQYSKHGDIDDDSFDFSNISKEEF